MPAFVCTLPSKGAASGSHFFNDKHHFRAKFCGLRRANIVDGVSFSPKTQPRRRAQFSVSSDIIVCSVAPRKVLVIGGTRFAGVYLVKALQDAGHEVTVFNRGRRGIQRVHGETLKEYEARYALVNTIVGDRKNPSDLAKLADEQFDVIYDNNGRERTDTEPLVEIFKDRVEHFVYMSSAGVYLMTDQLPYREGDAVDLKCRHKGKIETEEYLRTTNVPWTAIRPTYIYGPQNYNEVEAWFFKRVFANRPVPIPGHGQHMTGMGHVQDLADGMVAIIGNENAKRQVYNLQGDRYVTFDGLARACAEACGRPEPKIVHYNPKDFDFGKKKAFPFRLQHFFTSIEKAEQQLGWTPKYELVKGLEDSYWNDFAGKTSAASEWDFETDDMVLAKHS